jgi:hypothetical protein
MIAITATVFFMMKTLEHVRRAQFAQDQAVCDVLTQISKRISALEDIREDKRRSSVSQRDRQKS